MNKELAAIKDAWDKNTGNGRDENARHLARAYVKAHSELFTELEHLDVPALAALETSQRACGDTEGEWNTEAWLLACISPQKINGEIQLVNAVMFTETE